MLVVRVHPELLGRAALAGDAGRANSGGTGTARSSTLEKHLVPNGTVVVEVLAHVSKGGAAAQRSSRGSTTREATGRSARRSRGAQAYWDDYLAAYEAASAATSTDESPWYVVPADDKTYMRVAVSEVIVDVLRDLDLAYPVVPESEREQFAALERELLAEDP